MSRYHMTDRGHVYMIGPTETLHRDCRRVVVIDPEDEQQAERLLEIYYAQTGGRVVRGQATLMQTALRELADPTPPKPEEPLGFAAVVEDSRGRRWVRSSAGIYPWELENSSMVNPYRDIAAVQILSTGVEA